MMIKRLSVLLLLSFGCRMAAAQTPADSAAFATAAWQVVVLPDGAECRTAQIDLFGSRQSVCVVRYPRKKFCTKLVQLDGRACTTSRIGAETGAAMAINGSYFDMKRFAPVTFVMVDKKVLGRTIPSELMRTNGVVALRGRGGRRVAILRCDTAGYRRIARRYRSALAAGPLLVERGETVIQDLAGDFYTRRHPRSLVGTTRRGEVVFAVIDGRFAGRGEGTTIAQTAFIARQLGLEEALNLDGGGSSALWTAQQGVVSHPSDNGRYDHAGERAVPNAIVAIPRR